MCEVRGEEAEGLMGREDGNLMTHMDFNDRVSVFWRLLFIGGCFWFAGFAWCWGLFVID